MDSVMTRTPIVTTLEFFATELNTIFLLYEAPNSRIFLSCANEINSSFEFPFSCVLQICFADKYDSQASNCERHKHLTYALPLSPKLAILSSNSTAQ